MAEGMQGQPTANLAHVFIQQPSIDGVQGPIGEAHLARAGGAGTNPNRHTCAEVGSGRCLPVAGTVSLASHIQLLGINFSLGIKVWRRVLAAAALAFISRLGSALTANNATRGTIIFVVVVNEGSHDLHHVNTAGVSDPVKLVIYRRLSAQCA